MILKKHSNVVKNFIHQFYHSQFTPLEQALENQEVFFTDSDLESYVMTYAHGECHAWTLSAMMAANLEKYAIVIESDIGPLHSFISSEDEKYGLDANGVRKISDMLKEWRFLGKANGATRVWMMKYNREEFSLMCSLDEQAYDDALESMEYIFNFIEANSEKLN